VVLVREVVAVGDVRTDEVAEAAVDDRALRDGAARLGMVAIQGAD
jgi:hypothetical protein